MGYYGKYVESIQKPKTFRILYSMDEEYDSSDKEEAQVLATSLLSMAMTEALVPLIGDTSYL